MKFYDNLLGHDPSDLYNSRGHRCKELEDLNLRNYILFIGDNVTLRLDKPVEKTFPYIISNRLKMDYYNLAIFNGGLDALKYNLLTWYLTIPSKPKFIVSTCEFLNSFLVCDQNFENWKVPDFNDKGINEIFDAGNNNGFFTTKAFLADKILRNIIITPIYQICLKDKVTLFTENVTNLYYDGDLSDHETMAKLVIADYNSKTVVVRP